MAQRDPGGCADTLIQLRARTAGRIDQGVEVDATIAELLAAHEPVAIGVSGGKDSCAAAIATVEHLRAIGHGGPVVLVHADLGDRDPALDVEWEDSLPTCERLADFLGVELVITRRKAGGMMRRWLTRWDRNVARYASLSCVRIILPWSTPSMRFCTSELKSAPIAAALVKRFPGRRIVSACGIRREEGRGRASSPRTNAPTSTPNKRLKRGRSSGVDWNPIAAWTTDDVFSFCAARGFAMHEGHAIGMSRISCRFCIMQDQADQATSAGVPANVPVFLTVARLEIRSGFAFQGARWLADVAPHLLSAEERAALAAAKEMAARRNKIEARIPKHLFYTAGWPTVMPTMEEAIMLAEVRRDVGNLYGIVVDYTDPQAIIDRYAELMAANAARIARTSAKPRRKAAA